jgi:Ca2+-binding EF-hand superfamily protein
VVPCEPWQLAKELDHHHSKIAMAAAPGRPVTVDFEALSYISSLVEAFQAFDSDNDGLVTAPELRGLLASLGLEKSEAEARDMLARADADRDGRLSVEELLDVMNAGELGLGALGELLQSALPALEAAGGALVGADELARAIGAVGGASVEDCAAIVECLDGDGDGAITIEEFRFMADLL